MIHTIDRMSCAQGAKLRAMFEARKRVFVDLLKWDVPVVGGAWELDGFDDDKAVYLVLSDCMDRHLASARLLETTRPHILDTLFADLVDGDIPRGPNVLEITRFCLDRSLRATARRCARNRLVTGLVVYALVNGISRYTGVAGLDWYRQIKAFGWQCQGLGEPKVVNGTLVTALSINIDFTTPELLRSSGIWQTHSRFTPRLGHFPFVAGRA